jgi:hypothetical protein
MRGRPTNSELIDRRPVNIACKVLKRRYQYDVVLRRISLRLRRVCGIRAALSVQRQDPKPETELPFQGIPTAIYMDNGLVSRSKVFRSVMVSLGVRVLTHLPLAEVERRAAA